MGRSMTTDQATPVPVPEGFSVILADPTDEQMFWFQDNMHFPLAVTPANATIFQTAFAEGTSRAIARLSMPIAGLKTAVHNGYLYLGPVPVHDTPEALAQRFAEMQRLTMELGSTVLADWRATFEPDVLARAAAIMTYDYAGHSTAEVAQFVATFYNELVDVWDIHMRVNIPPMNAVFGLEAFLGEVLGDESAHESRLLL